MADETKNQLEEPAEPAQVASAPSDDVPLAPPLQRIFTKHWWKNSFLIACYFSRHCVVAATIWTLAGTVMVGGVFMATTRLAGGGIVSIETLLTAAAIAGSSLVTTLILMCWALGVWLIKMTAFAQSFLSLPVYEKTLDRASVIAKQKECVSQTWERKKYLAKFWFYMSIFLLLPFIWAGNLTALKIVSGNSTMVNRLITLPDYAGVVIIILLAFCSVLITQCSLIGLAVSAVSKKEPFPAAKEAMLLSFRNFGPGLLLAAMVALTNVCIASPQVILRLSEMDKLFSTNVNVTEMLIENLWQGLTSVILWTLVSAPLCELVRGRVE